MKSVYPIPNPIRTIQAKCKIQNLSALLILFVISVTLYLVVQVKPITKSTADTPSNAPRFEPTQTPTEVDTAQLAQVAPKSGLTEDGPITQNTSNNQTKTLPYEKTKNASSILQADPGPNLSLYEELPPAQSIIGDILGGALDTFLSQAFENSGFQPVSPYLLNSSALIRNSEALLQDRLTPVQPRVNTLSPLKTNSSHFINRLRFDDHKNERMNILLMGIDRRSGEKYGRTDAMILVTINPISKTAGMLSIPRDLWVSIPGYSADRINNAYFLGEKDQYPGGGPVLAIETVQNTLQVPVHFYALIDFDGFRKIVDALDGIDVCVPEPVEMFEVGYETMDSETALYYVRTRATPNADFGRIKRQQAVLLAMRDKTLQIDIIPKIPKLWSSITDAIDTNLSLLNIFTLAHLASEIKPENIRFAAIDYTLTIDYTTPDGAQVLLPRYDKIKVVVDEMFGGVVPAGGSVLASASAWELEMDTLCQE